MIPMRHRSLMTFMIPMRAVISQLSMRNTVFRLIWLASTMQKGMVGLVGHGLPWVGSCWPPKAMLVVSTWLTSRRPASSVMP